MNSEIVARLEQSFGTLPQGTTEQQLEPPLHPHMEAIFRSTLSETEQSLIKILPPFGFVPAKGPGYSSEVKESALLDHP